MILETPQERVKLLKAGLTGRQIETIYVQLNHFNIVGYVLYNWDAIGLPNTNGATVISEKNVSGPVVGVK